MPVEHPHPRITAPSDPAARAWRYMDFAKFISLIARRELYFCNLEVLAATDPHDGLLSQPNYRHRQWHSIADLAPEEYKIVFFENMTGERQRIQFESQKNSREYWLRRRFYDRRTLLINCWHLNQYESAAMWVQYAIGGQGIAITSTFQKIMESLVGASEILHIGMVKYLDWENETVDNTFVLPFSKRRSFAHEQELRIVYWDPDVQQQVNLLCQRLAQHTFDHLYRRITTPINWALIENDVSKVGYKSGIYIPVNIDELIEEVYVSPSAPDWFAEVVKAACDKFGLKKSPIRSDILSQPIR
jgi:hypothetical protein